MSTRTKFFGQFLLERGAVSRETLLAAARRKSNVGMPLAVQALKDSRFSVQQLAELDRLRAVSGRHPMRIALARGMVEFCYLEELGRRNADSWMLLAENLLKWNCLSMVALDELIREYGKRGVASVLTEELKATLEDAPDRDTIVAFVLATVDLFLHYTRQIVRLAGVDQGDVDVGDDEKHVFAQRIVGDRSLYFAIVLPEELVLAIASRMVDEEIEEVDEDVKDAVTELLNTIVGNACMRLGMADANVTARPPQAMNEMLEVFRTMDAYTIKMTTAKSVFELLFMFDSQVG